VPRCREAAMPAIGRRCRDAENFVQTFCTSSRRPETGRSRRRPGRHGRPLETGRGRPCQRPSAGVQGARPRTAEERQRRGRRKVAAVDRRGLGDAAKLPAPGRGRVPSRRGLRLLRLRRGGAPALGWPRHPPPTTRASRAHPRRRPPAWLPRVKAALTWRAPAVACSLEGGSRATGWLQRSLMRRLVFATSR
jgi:hypothetical protein